VNNRARILCDRSLLSQPECSLKGIRGLLGQASRSANESRSQTSPASTSLRNTLLGPGGLSRLCEFANILRTIAAEYRPKS
jgi:hypothetical protein